MHKNKVTILISAIRKIDVFFNKHLVDKIAKYIIYGFGAVSVLILIAIIVFIVISGLPVFKEIGVFDFIFGTEWSVRNNTFGIFYMILGSLVVTALALAFSVVISIGCAILLAEIAPTGVRNVLRPLIELLAGIPSVVYGLIGLVILVPIIGEMKNGSGFSILAGGIVLALMVLPTIVSISEDAIRAVPRSYNQGALALGASKWQSLWHVILPAAKSGIIVSIILGAGRAIGETMALVMVIGNSFEMFTSIFDPARTMTTNIAMDANYAEGLHRDALFATATVLLFTILLINSLATVILNRKAKVNRSA